MKDNSKTFLIGMKHLAVCVGLALFLVTITFPVAVSYAGEYGFPEYYPGNFDGSGRINRIAADEVVINDILFKLSPEVEYHTRTTQNASSAWLKKGQIVGYINSSSSRREIVSLWLIE